MTREAFIFVGGAMALGLIAGAVIGPLAPLALVVGMFWGGYVAPRLVDHEWDRKRS